MKRPEDMSRDDLEQEVRIHREGLFIAEQSERARVLRLAFGLTPGASHLVLALYNAAGKPVSRGRLGIAMPARGRAEDSDIDGLVKVVVTKARQCLGPEAIETCPYGCYRLADEGQRAVGFALMRSAA